MEQLILHLFGDYITQSDWMANGKTSKYTPAAVHAIVYSLPFLLLGPSWIALGVICVTHFFIDRFRLAKYVVYAKNFLAPVSAWTEKETVIDPIYRLEQDVLRIQDKYTWENCKATGYPSETPAWLATWLMIIADNAMHLAINFLSLKYL